MQGLATGCWAAFKLLGALLAITSRAVSCCFYLSTTDGALVGQLTDGQIRFGDRSLTSAEFCITPDGSLIDSERRECVITCELCISM